MSDSVQAAIRARLARLDADAHELARAASVLGGDVDFDHAGAVAGQDEDRALAALERLLSTHLLREVSGDVGTGEALYSFSHDKVRQVVYDDLSAARRRVRKSRDGPVWRVAGPGGKSYTSCSFFRANSLGDHGWGRSHDIANLYIIDGSIWPTSAGMNPTATIAALALRIADHLVEERRNQAVAS